MKYIVRGNLIVIEDMPEVDTFPNPVALRISRNNEIIKLLRRSKNEFELIDVETSLDGEEVQFFPNWDPASIQYGKRP